MRWPVRALPSALPARYASAREYRLLGELGLSVAAIHATSASCRCASSTSWTRSALVDSAASRSCLLRTSPSGGILTFQLPDAGAVCKQLHACKVITDYHDDRLRVGFGIYHDENDISTVLPPQSWSRLT
jgi:kynureninase